MKILVNRSRFLWGGFLLLGFFILLNRFQFLLGTDETKGIARYYWYNENQYPLIEYFVDGKLYYIQWDSDHGVKFKDVLPIRYKTDNPDDARIFTFWGFWMVPVFYSLVVVIVFVPVTIVLFEKYGTIILDFSKIKMVIDRKSKKMRNQGKNEIGKNQKLS